MWVCWARGGLPTLYLGDAEEHPRKQVRQETSMHRARHILLAVPCTREEIFCACYFKKMYISSVDLFLY